MTGRQWEKSLVARAGSVGLLCGWLALSVFANGCATAGASGAGSTSVKASAPAVIAAAPPAELLQKKTVVSRMELIGEENSVRVRFGGDGAVDYSLSRTGSPDEIVLDLKGARFEGLSGVNEIDDGVIRSVTFGEEGKVSVKLAAASDYSVQKTENGVDLVIVPRGEKATEKPLAKAPAVEGKDKPVLEISTNSFVCNLGSDARGISSFLLSDGMRLVIDLEGVALGGGEVVREYEEGPIARVVMRSGESGVRAVVEARSRIVFSDYKISQVPCGFAIKLDHSEETASISVAAAQVSETPASAAPAKTPAAPAAKPAENMSGLAEVVDFGFHQDAQRSYVDLSTSKPVAHEVREATGTRVVMDLLRTSLTSKFQRALDTSAFNGPVKIIAAYQRGADTRVIVDLKNAAPFNVEKKDSALSIAFEGGSSQPEAVAETPGTERIILERNGETAVPADMAAPTQSGTVMVDPKGPVVRPVSGPVGPNGQKKGYTGSRISMDFVDADIRNVLRLIGEVAGINMVTGSEVSGSITIRLIDVPWDQALDVILKAKNLDKDLDGNIMRIVSAEKIANERNQQILAIEAAKKLEKSSTPLASEIFPVNYALAKEVLDKLKTVLSDRGSAVVDERTNTILVRDLPENIEIARELVARLDTPTPQVLIEARIVEVESNYSEDLGIQWGGEYKADAAHGNSTGFGFPNSIGVKGATGAENFIVNLPVGVGTAGSAGGAFALSMGHINDVLSLDLRIAALETSGKGRIVSSPRVTTLDNKVAEISQGLSIPFNVVSGEETSIKTMDYLLLLKVTPHVTSDASIMLKMEIKKDDVSSITASDGTPGKQTRTANTEVLVKDGETAVIGGIITDSTRETVSGIPWFQKIPFVGWLFKSKQNKTSKTELIIFITPKIVQMEQAASL
ncbi:type IV pilus secretin family protein [bacterium]|nr:MAG: type IV pilus secretin family protein [bacterium]